MDPENESRYRARLIEMLAESLATPIPDSTPRRIYGKASLPGKATAVVGMRRAGKTTYLHQLRRERLASGVPQERLIHLNFEDEQLAGLTSDHLHILLDEYYRRFPSFRQAETTTWCLDEIQVVPGWERFLRRVLDTEQIEIFLSGSSAALLSRELGTAMRGRAWEVLLHPFSFEEYLRHHQLPVPADLRFLAPVERSGIERAFLDYLSSGGFPEAQGQDPVTRRQLLRDYVDVAMLRDVMERHGVTNVTALRWLVRHLLSNAAGKFSVQKFYGSLKSQGLKVSKDSVHDLLAHLEDCFLVRTVWMESTSERQRMVNPRKAYPADPGLIPVFERSGRANVGPALETAVLIELERRRVDVTYVKTKEGHEADFLTRGPDEEMEVIQVCADPTDPATAARELRGLEEAKRMFPGAGSRLLTLTADPLQLDAPAGIVVQPAYSWMLEGVGE
ncbi:ATP-binding protein [Acidobacteriota bacterium]